MVTVTTLDHDKEWIASVCFMKQRKCLFSTLTTNTHRTGSSPLPAPCCNVQRRWPRWGPWGRRRTGKRSWRGWSGWGRWCCLCPGAPPCLCTPGASPACGEDMPGHDVNPNNAPTNYAIIKITPWEQCTETFVTGVGLLKQVSTCLATQRVIDNVRFKLALWQECKCL